MAAAHEPFDTHPVVIVRSSWQFNLRNNYSFPSEEIQKVVPRTNKFGPNIWCRDPGLSGISTTALSRASSPFGLLPVEMVADADTKTATLARLKASRGAHRGAATQYIDKARTLCDVPVDQLNATRRNQLEQLVQNILRKQDDIKQKNAEIEALIPVDDLDAKSLLLTTTWSTSRIICTSSGLI